MTPGRDKVSKLEKESEGEAWKGRGTQHRQERGSEINFSKVEFLLGILSIIPLGARKPSPENTLPLCFQKT